VTARSADALRRFAVELVLQGVSGLRLAQAQVGARSHAPRQRRRGIAGALQYDQNALAHGCTTA